MQQIKAANFNFIRLGHYPQDDYTLHLCDSLGLIVWEELPSCRGGVGGANFKQYVRQMLFEMIEQHYNCPSLVFWGLDNEFLTLDPRRLTALRRFEQGARIVDVYSPSIWSGWYRGRYQDYQVVLQQAIERYPRMLHIESSAWPLRVQDDLTPQTIRVITNCDTVALSINGTHYQKQQSPDAAIAAVLTWSLALPPGKTVIHAVGYRDGISCAEHVVTQTLVPGNRAPVAQAMLSTQVTTGSIELYLQLADADRHPVTTDEQRVQFDVHSGGSICRHQGLIGGSDVVTTANGRAWVCFNRMAKIHCMFPLKSMVCPSQKSYCVFQHPQAHIDSSGIWPSYPLRQIHHLGDTGS